MIEHAPYSSGSYEALEPVPLAVIFDLDDTLFDTSLSVEKLLLPKLAARGVSAQMLTEAREAAHQNGNKSLDVIEYTIQQCGQEAWDEIAAEYVQEGRDLNLLLPGATAAMDLLRAAEIPFGIKTYGTPALQALKRSAMQLPDDVPFYVIDHRNKGVILSEMYDEKRGVFMIEWLGHVAAVRVAMFENDPTAFRGLEEHMAEDRVLGLWTPHSDGDRMKLAPEGVREEKDLASAMSTLAVWADIATIDPDRQL